MGSFVAEAGTDVSLEEERVKSNFKGDTADEKGVRRPPLPVPQGGNNPKGISCRESADGLKVDENEALVKEEWGFSEPGEPDCVQKCNGNPDSQIYENGDGDLPSFSIKRLRRLPLRLNSDHLPSALAPAVDRNLPDDDRVEKLVVSEGTENIRERKTFPDPSTVGAAHSSGDSVGAPERVQSSFDFSRSNESTSGRPLNVLEERTHPVDASGVRNGDIESRNLKSENGKLAIEEPEFRNPGSGGDQSVGRVNGEVPVGREEQAGNVWGQEVTGIKKDVSSEYASKNSNVSEGECGSRLPQSHESHLSSSNPGAGHGAPVDGLDVSPGTSGLSTEVRDESDKLSLKVEQPAPVREDWNRDGNGKDPEDVNSGALIKPAALSSPGIVHILPPVMGIRFGSPGETTDEETDSPRSSEGFAYPDSDPMTLPYSEQIMYPSRISSTQASNGPSILQYSGSMSLRSDSSTTSNRSFAFPILAPPEWNSSPARMAKAQPRRKNRFDGCCFFRLSRSRYEY